jgi:ABC-type polysaccharide/polyol phosphate transport system ATPase subunit
MDTPVKRYPSTWLRASSSGMYVRLAFAVAAHRSAERSRRSLEPEILLVDESPP